MRNTRRSKAEIRLITHTCPKGHTWKSMLVNAKNCPVCRKEERQREQAEKSGESDGEVKK